MVRLLVALLLSAALVADEAPRRLVGYVADWSVAPETVPLAQLTHLNYAFALPQEDGGLKAPAHPRRLEALARRARPLGVKVLLSVGGWGQAQAFAQLAAQAEGRAGFVRALLAYVEEHQLDGIDMDWEHPRAGAQAEQFASLMHELALGLHGRGRLLTAAVHAVSSAGIAAAVMDDVDFLNLMAYDGNEGPGHSPVSYALAALDHWRQRGLSRDKTVLGVPFYAQPRHIPWRTIAAAGPEAMLADVWTIAGTTVHYNGTSTMRSKAALARERCGGMMIWELGFDAGGEASLMSILHASYLGSP